MVEAEDLCILFILILYALVGGEAYYTYMYVIDIQMYHIDINIFLLVLLSTT